MTLRITFRGCCSSGRTIIELNTTQVLYVTPGLFFRLSPSIFLVRIRLLPFLNELRTRLDRTNAQYNMIPYCTELLLIINYWEIPRCVRVCLMEKLECVDFKSRHVELIDCVSPGSVSTSPQWKGRSSEEKGVARFRGRGLGVKQRARVRNRLRMEREKERRKRERRPIPKGQNEGASVTHPNPFRFGYKSHPQHPLRRILFPNLIPFTSSIQQPDHHGLKNENRVQKTRGDFPKENSESASLVSQDAKPGLQWTPRFPSTPSRNGREPSEWSPGSTAHGKHRSSPTPRSACQIGLESVKSSDLLDSNRSGTVWNPLSQGRIPIELAICPPRLWSALKLCFLITLVCDPFVFQANRIFIDMMMTIIDSKHDK